MNQKTFCNKIIIYIKMKSRNSNVLWNTEQLQVVILYRKDNIILQGKYYTKIYQFGELLLF